MSHVVIIPTVGRRELVARTAAHLARQTTPPALLVISVPAAADAPVLDGLPFPVEVVTGRKGTTAQRNRALESVLDRCELVTFFDDDFVPAPDYLEIVAHALRTEPGWAVIRGEFEDGARKGGFTFDEGRERLDKLIAARPPGPARVTDHVGGHGTNFSFRAADVGSLRFDERLPLHGWQEEIDFTSQMRRAGRIVSLGDLLGIHLAVRNTRSNGISFGYTQIVNPVYLVRKGTLPLGFALELMCRNIAANTLRCLRPEPHVDRRGRLRGNLLGAFHVLTGRIEPERVLRLVTPQPRS